MVDHAGELRMLAGIEDEIGNGGYLRRIEILRGAADEIERLRGLLRSALYHVDSEGDVSLATKMRREFEQ